MKITQVISDSNIGGAGILLSSIAAELQNEFDFEIIIPKSSKLSERLPKRGITVTELPISSDRSFDMRNIGMLRAYFKEHKPHIVHTHASLSARIAARLAGVEVCLSTRHCAYPEGKVKRKNLMQRIIYNHFTDLTVSTAEYATRNLISEGIDKSRIITICNGVRISQNQDTGTDLSIYNALGIPRGARVIGSVARLEPVKGQDLIIRAAARLAKDFTDVYFLFLGDGSMASEYRSLAAGLGIKDRCIFAGYVEDPGIYQRGFYVNVNASRGTETSCLATSECMGLGIPTVASDFGGNREMIEDGVNGLIFKTDNAFDIERCLREILASDGLRERLSAGAKRIFEERFSIDGMIAKYRMLYLNAAEGHARHKGPYAEATI